MATKTVPAAATPASASGNPTPWPQPQADEQPTPRSKRRVLHEPFSWVPSWSEMSHVSTDLADYADLACKTRDVAGGVAVILSMLEQDMIDEGCDADDGTPAPALLSGSAAGELLRLAIVACEFLRDEGGDSTSSIHRMAKHQRREGQQ